MKYLVGQIVQRLACFSVGRILLRIGMCVVARRQYVGAVGAVVNAEGKILLARHAYRTDYQWGLPGGWVEPGESPAEAVEREFSEELNLNVTVERLLLCDVVTPVRNSIAPRHLGLAFRCRLIGGQIRTSHEILAVDWIDGRRIPYDVASFQARAIAAAVGEGH